MIRMTQTDNIINLKLSQMQDEFISTNLLVQYIVVCSRPEISTPVQLISPGKEPTTTDDIKLLSKDR